MTIYFVFPGHTP